MTALAERPKVIEFPAHWDSVTFPKNRANCGVFKVVTTLEIMGKAQRDIYRHLVDDDSTGNFLYIPNGADPEQVKLPTEPAPLGRGFKSPSQRLRAVLFVAWKAAGEQGDFEDYYKGELTYIINSYKDLLPERA